MVKNSLGPFKDEKEDQKKRITQASTKVVKRGRWTRSERKGDARRMTLYIFAESKNEGSLNDQTR